VDALSWEAKQVKMVNLDALLQATQVKVVNLDALSWQAAKVRVVNQ
jgi:hypothetical protein